MAGGAELLAGASPLDRQSRLYQPSDLAIEKATCIMLQRGRSCTLLRSLQCKYMAMRSASEFWAVAGRARAPSAREPIVGTDSAVLALLRHFFLIFRQ